MENMFATGNNILRRKDMRDGRKADADTFTNKKNIPFWDEPAAHGLV